MHNKADEAMVNAFGWLSEECMDNSEHDRILFLLKENKKMRRDAEELKWTALSELYFMVTQMFKDQNPDYGKKVCLRAEALIKLCFKLRYIDRIAFLALLHYTEAKMQEYTIQDNNK